MGTGIPDSWEFGVNCRGFGSNFPDPPPIANVHALVHIIRLLLITLSKKSFLKLDVFFIHNFLHNSFHLHVQTATVAQWLDGPASGRLGVRIPAATDVSRKSR